MLNEAQAGIMIPGRNINFRYAGNTPLMAGSEEELTDLMMVKGEREKASLKLNIQKNENHGIWSQYFMANRCRKKWKQ